MAKSDIRLYKVLIIPVLISLMMFSSFSLMFFFGYRDLDGLLRFFSFKKLIVVSIQAMIVVIVYYHIVKWYNKVLPWSKIWVLRFIADACCVIILAVAGIALLTYLENNGIIPFGMKHHEIDFIYVIPIMMNSFYMVVVEMVLAIEMKNQLAVQLAQLEKQQINAKYQALKSQIDHHFLFNNLSVLSSIIYEDVEKSDVFIQKLSKVYRYVLSINKQDLVSVEDELEFITSYLDLYKFRFEDGFSYNINIEDSHSSCLIPPLTLQVLVENTIKHNVVSRNQPLQVDIYSENDSLVVQNNIQLRENQVDSTKTGLNNLREKYQLLKAKEPTIMEQNGIFQVYIALIPEKNG